MVPDGANDLEQQKEPKDRALVVNDVARRRKPSTPRTGAGASGRTRDIGASTVGGRHHGLQGEEWGVDGTLGGDGRWKWVRGTGRERVYHQILAPCWSTKKLVIMVIVMIMKGVRHHYLDLSSLRTKRVGD